MMVRSGVLRGAAVLTAPLLALAAADPAAADPLAGQRIEGAQRVCTYRSNGETPSDGLTGIRIGRSESVRRHAGEPVEIRVGAAEPCPFWHVDRPPESAEIPTMATLEGEAQSDGNRVCFYRYLGERYVRAAPVAASCPLTPAGSE